MISRNMLLITENKLQSVDDIFKNYQDVKIWDGMQYVKILNMEKVENINGFCIHCQGKYFVEYDENHSIYPYNCDSKTFVNISNNDQMILNTNKLFMSKPLSLADLEQDNLGNITIKRQLTSLEHLELMCRNLFVDNEKSQFFIDRNESHKASYNFILKVKGISPIKSETFYKLIVDDKNHLFICNGILTIDDNVGGNNTV